MTPFFYPARKNWRVQIPASETETGKRTSRFFPTKEVAEEFIQEHYKAGSVQLAELSRNAAAKRKRPAWHRTVVG
jgi:hypothetical protein